MSKRVVDSAAEEKLKVMCLDCMRDRYSAVFYNDLGTAVFACDDINCMTNKDVHEAEISVELGQLLEAVCQR